MTGLAQLMAATLLAGTLQPAPPAFEKVGTPVMVRELPLGAVTHDPAGYDVAWGMLNVAGGGEQALVGIRLDTGAAALLDVSSYGPSKTTCFPGADGTVYVYSGSPAHFLRYDPASRELKDLGAPAQPANYFANASLAPDGYAYIGSYPDTQLAWCNTKTGEVGTMGRISPDKLEAYIIQCAAADDGWVYAGVGLHHMELWACNRASGVKRQILPEKYLAYQGNPTVWTGADGKVYGRAKEVTFLCTPQGVQELPAPPARSLPLRSGDWSLSGVDTRGVITLTQVQTQEKKTLQTTYAGHPAKVFSVACERDGVLYGSSCLPGNVFTLDTKSGKLSDLGVITRGPFQVYDAISRPEGIFFATYMGCHIDLYRPDRPLKKGENPQYLGRAEGQERPMQWCVGPDGMLYTGTIPAKGRLGGALMQVDPEKLTIRQFDHPVPNLSPQYLESLPELGLLFATCTVGGGSSAVPVEKEAVCFLWDCKQERVVWQGKPLPGVTSYGRALRARDGLLYGVADGRFYVFDPVKRETVQTGELPVPGLAFPGLNDEPVGPKGLLVGIGGGAVVAIDPATRKAEVLARHESLSGAHGFTVDSTGTLYYGSGTEVWRVKLPL